MTGKISSENRCSRIAASFSPAPWILIGSTLSPGDHVEQIRQPDDVIEMRVGQKNVEPIGRQIIGRPDTSRCRRRARFPTRATSGKPFAAGRWGGSRPCPTEQASLLRLDGGQLFQSLFQRIEQVAGRVLHQRGGQFLDRPRINLRMLQSSFDRNLQVLPVDSLELRVVAQQSGVSSESRPRPTAFRPSRPNLES